MEYYQKTVKHAEERLKKSIFCVSLAEKKLPKPDNLETDDIPLHDYHRFAVSYGLSFSEVDIGRIIPQRKVPDIMLPEPLEKDIDKWFVDKDMV
jgi:hypoxanthine-guanine phosphoribosyltransferase